MQNEYVYVVYHLDNNDNIESLEIIAICDSIENAILIMNETNRNRSYFNKVDYNKVKLNQILNFSYFKI